jgi:hypothetical protein
MLVAVKINNLNKTYDILDTDDMRVETVSKDYVYHTTHVLRIPIAGLNPEVIRVSNDLALENHCYLLQERYYKDFYFSIIISDAIKYNTDFQVAIIDRLDNMVLYEKFMDLYCKLTKGSYILKENKFRKFKHFIYQDRFYITNGVDLVHCPVSSLANFYKKYINMSKIGFMQGLKFDICNDTFLVDHDMKNLTFYSGYNYELNNFITVSEKLTIQDNVNIINLGYKIHTVALYYFGSDINTILSLLQIVDYNGIIDLYCRKSLDDALKYSLGKYMYDSLRFIYVDSDK